MAMLNQNHCDLWRWQAKDVKGAAKYFKLTRDREKALGRRRSRDHLDKAKNVVMVGGTSSSRRTKVTGMHNFGIVSRGGPGALEGAVAIRNLSGGWFWPHGESISRPGYGERAT
jgi:hypothetical protein